MNDRLREIVNGSTTTFTMDLNAGLTQALNDGTKSYIYGNGRIAQVGTGTEYFLGDALGSVRQMTNASSTISYAKAYDPYGVVTSTSGASSTAYGYMSEYTSQGLLYLRSRMYTPATGRFTAKDSWMGDYNRPLSLNRWMYVEGNPINRVDPSGHCQRPDGSWDWLKWPWFGQCTPNTSGPIITATPPLIAIITAIATACATPAPTSTGTPPPTGTPTGISTPPTYVESWKRYKDYDPASNSIPFSKWGGLDSNQWDSDRAEIVWKWLGEAQSQQRWWSDTKELTAWLLWHESGAMFSENAGDDVYNEGGGMDAAKLMIRFMKRLFSDGVDKLDLARFTPFFNPNSGGAFDQGDWDELMTLPAYYPYVNTVNTFWGLEPLYQEITWWVPNEPGFSQYTPIVTVRHPNGSGDILYLAYK